MLSENKSPFNLNTLLLIILIVLVTLGLFFIIRQQPSSISPEDTTDTNSITDSLAQISTPLIEEISAVERMEWKKSPKFGLYYPEGFELFENMDPETGNEMRISSSFTNAIISWGGPQSSCTDPETYIFDYGVSTTACVKGLRAQIGLTDVRNVLTSRDLHLFGYFVMKNS